MNCSEKILTSFESLLRQPFMAITSGKPVYEIDSKHGPAGYSQLIAWLQLDNVRPEVVAAFNRDYNSLSAPFTEWAKSQSFVSSQILGGDNSTLVFEITVIC